MKGMVFGLLLANALFISWHYLLELREDSFRQDVASLSGPRIEQTSEVHLVAEVAGDSLHYFGSQSTDMSLTLVDLERPAAAVSVVSGYCAEIGPFENSEDAGVLMNAFATQEGVKLEKRSASRALEYRVYLPPLPTRELAAQAIDRLRAAFASNNLAIDTFLIPRGELANGIALGLFSEQRNAINVSEQLRVLGYEVTVREEEGREAHEYWIISEQFDSKEKLDYQMSQIGGLSISVQYREKLCQTIAQESQFP